MERIVDADQLPLCQRILVVDDLFGAPQGESKFMFVGRNKDAQPPHCMHRPRLEQIWISI
jgi:hypothetical protein